MLKGPPGEARQGLVSMRDSTTDMRQEYTWDEHGAKALLAGPPNLEFQSRASESASSKDITTERA